MKTYKVEIEHGEGVEVYTIGSLAFGATMANPLLRGMLGFDKAVTGKVEDELAETDLPDEDKPEVEEKAAAPDLADLMPAVICATVREHNGEPVSLTVEDVEQMDMAIAVTLFNAIHDVLNLAGGGQKAVTFRVVNGVEAAAG